MLGQKIHFLISVMKNGYHRKLIGNLKSTFFKWRNWTFWPPEKKRFAPKIVFFSWSMALSFLQLSRLRPRNIPSLYAGLQIKGFAYIEKVNISSTSEIEARNKDLFRNLTSRKSVPWGHIQTKNWQECHQQKRRKNDDFLDVCHQ